MKDIRKIKTDFSLLTIHVLPKARMLKADFVYDVKEPCENFDKELKELMKLYERN